MADDKEKSYNIYLRRIDVTPVVLIDIEEEFRGLHYVSCDGLLVKGKPKNIETEEYADAEQLRYYMPKNVVRETTDINLKLCFVGEDRDQAYEDFCDFVSVGVFEFWDSVRRRKATIILQEAINPQDDTRLGSQPYFIAEFRFTNIYGESPLVPLTDFMQGNTI